MVLRNLGIKISVVSFLIFTGCTTAKIAGKEILLLPTECTAPGKCQDDQKAIEFHVTVWRF